MKTKIKKGEVGEVAGEASVPEVAGAGNLAKQMDLPRQSMISTST